MKHIWLPFASLFFFSHAAVAHPHVWVTVRSQVVFEKSGAITGIQHAWTFDEAYSAYATMGMKKSPDGEILREELQNIAHINVAALKEFHYFSKVSSGDREILLSEPTDYRLEFVGGRVTLHFLVPLGERLKATTPVVLEVYDPTFFVSLTLSGAEDAISMRDDPPGCAISIERPSGVEGRQRQLPESFFSSLQGSNAYGLQFANRATITCPQ